MNLFWYFFIILSSATWVLGSSPNLDHGNKSRIVMGSDVKPGYFYYHVSIQYLGHVCSGVIIGPRWVLTVASCVVGLSEVLTTIRHGSIYHNTGGELTGVRNFVIHPNFNRTNLMKNLALVYTAEKMNTTPYGHPNFIFPNRMNTSKVSLASEKNHFFCEDGDDFHFWITGWGFKMSTTGTLSAILQQVLLPLLSPNDCVKAYSNSGIPFNDETMYCVGCLNNGGPGICEGDQGGPMIMSANGKLWGLASFSDGCGQPQKPSVYTGIDSKWIRTVTSIYLN